MFDEETDAEMRNGYSKSHTAVSHQKGENFVYVRKHDLLDPLTTLSFAFAQAMVTRLLNRRNLSLGHAALNRLLFILKSVHLKFWNGSRHFNPKQICWESRVSKGCACANIHEH